MKTVSQLLSIILCTASAIAGTNMIYRRYDDNGSLDSKSLFKGSRPAEFDPEGNWGPIVEGFQLSLRFEKNTFGVGEPVAATIILRNVTDAPLIVGPIVHPRLLVVDAQRQLVPAVDNNYGHGRHVSGPARIGIPQGRQIDLHELVTESFDLSKKGSYLIYVMWQIPKEDSNGYTEIRSDNVVIDIVDKPNTANVRNSENSLILRSIASTPTSTSPPLDQVMQSLSASFSAAKLASSQHLKPIPRNMPQSSLKTADNKTLPLVATVETGAGWSSRDWVYGVLVLGLALGIGWYLFRARLPHPRK